MNFKSMIAVVISLGCLTSSSALADCYAYGYAGTYAGDRSSGASADSGSCSPGDLQAAAIQTCSNACWSVGYGNIGGQAYCHVYWLDGNAGVAINEQQYDCGDVP
jgi:hypothetical protein